MMDDLTRYMIFWPVINAFVLLLGGWALWSLAKKFVTHENFDVYLSSHAQDHHKLDERMSEGDTRFTRLETSMNNLPTRADIQNLTESLAKITDRVSELNGRFSGIERSLSVLSDNVNAIIKHELAEGRDAKGRL